MSKVGKQAEALRAECQRLADEAVKKAAWATDPQEKCELLDAAQAYRNMAVNHAETAKHSEIAYPRSFRGRNKGKQSETLDRIEFLQRVKAETGHTKRQAIALAAWDQSDVEKFFDSYEKLYRFLGRDDIF